MRIYKIAQQFEINNSPQAQLARRIESMTYEAFKKSTLSPFLNIKADLISIPPTLTIEVSPLSSFNAKNIKLLAPTEKYELIQKRNKLTKDFIEEQPFLTLQYHIESIIKQPITIHFQPAPSPTYEAPNIIEQRYITLKQYKTKLDKNIMNRRYQDPPPSPKEIPYLNELSAISDKLEQYLEKLKQLIPLPNYNSSYSQRHEIYLKINAMIQPLLDKAKEIIETIR